MKFLMVYPNSTGNQKVPLGIVYLLTILKNAGHSVKLFDMTFYGVELNKHDINIRGQLLNFQPIDLEPYGVIYKNSTMNDVEVDLVNEILNFQPDLIGFSITEDTSKIGFHLAEVAKSTSDALTIFGGVYCFSDPEYVIKQPAVDMVCVAEGEVLLPRIMDSLSKGHLDSNIPGLWLKTPDGVTKNNLSAPVNMDSLPYMDLSLIDDRHFFNPMAGHVYKMTFVQSQRGCPRRCSFCCNQLFLDTYNKAHKGTYLRKQSIKRFVEELSYQKNRHNFNFFQIVDDDFTFRPLDEIIEFSRLYRENVNLPFYIQAEANNITYEKMSHLKNAGLMTVAMGIETGSDFIREQVFKRKTSKESTIKAFQIMHSLGIRTSGNVIIGVPHETRENIFETIELVRQCNPRSLNVNIFAPYFGTELRDYAVKQGYLDESFRRSSEMSWQPVLNMPQISSNEIMGLVRTFVLYCTLPKSYWGKIRMCESSNDSKLLEELEQVFWGIADKNGINVDLPIDYDKFLKDRQRELK